MRVRVMTMRNKGRNQDRASQLKLPKHVGNLWVSEHRDVELGRPVLRARLTDVASGTESDLLPELDDARLLWAGQGAMRLSGFERIDGTAYAQTWSLELA